MIPGNRLWQLASQSAMILRRMIKNSNKMGSEFLWKTRWLSRLTAVRSMSVKVTMGPNSSSVRDGGDDRLLINSQARTATHTNWWLNANVNPCLPRHAGIHFAFSISQCEGRLSFMRVNVRP
jgi:hypothetical protein